MLANARTHAAFAAVVAFVAAGLADAVFRSRPVEGAVLISGGLIVGALARSVLSERDAGMLANRSRNADTVIMAGLGFAMLVISLTLRATYNT